MPRHASDGKAGTLKIVARSSPCLILALPVIHDFIGEELDIEHDGEITRGDWVTLELRSKLRHDLVDPTGSGESR